VPDRVILLSLPLELSQSLLMERYHGDAAKKDIHEADLAYLQQCRISAAYAARKLGWTVIDCANADGTQIRSISAIHEDVYAQIREVL
jgi:dTMP kinase